MIKHIKVDVYCHWNSTSPSYRVYVDNDMLTERSFGWPGYQVFIRENIICNLDPGMHTIRIENCSPAGVRELSSFEIKNLTVENAPAAIHPNYTPTTEQIAFLVE